MKCPTEQVWLTNSRCKAEHQHEPCSLKEKIGQRSVR